MKTNQRRLTLCRREDWMSGVFQGVALEGDSLVLRSGQASGLACLPVVDAGEAGFEWSRLSLDCRLPADSLIRVYARASDNKSWDGGEDLDAGLHQLAEDPARFRGALGQLFGPPVGDADDLLLHRAGRYLWLVLELIGAGTQKPRVNAVTLRLTGDHMVDYLPSIYQEDDFTRRFVSIFDSLDMDMEQQIYNLPRRLDYQNTDEAMLRMLASWVCLEPEGPPEQLVDWISTALEDYDTLYTVQGVKRSVYRLTGRQPLIIEHDAVNPNAALCRNPALYRRLYGEDPFKFFVLLPEDTFPTRQAMEGFLEQMKTRIPAGTQLELVLLKRCVQLDWHTYLGVNSVISSYIPIAIDENITIHYDTMIGGSSSE